MAMRDELARLRAARREVHSVDHVVEPPLEQLQERAAGLTRDARRFAEIILELRLVNAIVAAHLLLVTQLAAVFRNLLTTRLALCLLPRRRAATFDRALFGETAVAFEEKLDLFAGLARGGFAAAETADRTRVTRHASLSAASAGGSRCAGSASRP